MDENPTTTDQHKDEATKEMPNLMFYMGVIKSKPSGDYIDVIHQHWYHWYIILIEKAL
jgi:hypothetical protein